MPTIRQYEYFVTLAHTLHFGRAAEKLNVAQPALSAQLRAMEGEMGVTLFSRNRRNVVLSPAGALLLPEAESLLRQYKRTKELGRQVAVGEIGSLRLAYVGSAALGGVMAKIIHEFRNSAPNVELEFFEMDMEQQLDEIARGRLDGGFIRLPLPIGQTNFEQTVIQSEDIVVALRTDHPLAAETEVQPAALKDERFILTHLKPHMGFAANIHMVCAEAGFMPTEAHRARQFSIIVNMVAAGLGIAILPGSMRRFDFPEVVYLPLAGVDLCSEVALIAMPEPASPAARNFLELAKSWKLYDKTQKGNS